MTPGTPTPPIWRCGRFDLPLDRPLVMGILNVTPDSFSDGGTHADLPGALAHARALVEAGADIIDVGGESTRPGSDEVPVAEELARVVPVVSALCREFGVPVSVDTRHAEVAAACVAEGADILNDISGFEDPAMRDLAAGCNAGLVVMHMRGEPKTMQAEPVYTDVVAEVRDYLVAQAALLEGMGVARERISLDPGLGFGKTTAHNLAILRDLAVYGPLGYPLFIGASRKRFVGDITGEAVPAARMGGSVAVALWSARAGATILRVHDVRETAQALRMWTALAEE